MKISLSDGKYEIICDENGIPLKCLRHGEEWRDLLGDNLVFSLVFNIIEMQDEFDRLKNIMHIISSDDIIRAENSFKYVDVDKFHGKLFDISKAFDVSKNTIEEALDFLKDYDPNKSIPEVDDMFTRANHKLQFENNKNRVHVKFTTPENTADLLKKCYEAGIGTIISSEDAEKLEASGVDLSFLRGSGQHN